MPEAVIYLNEKWHTGQLKDASYQLATISRKVLGHVMPLVAAIDPDLDWLEGTVEVRNALIPQHVPSYLMNEWDSSENSVFKFLASLPYHNTPGKIDKRLRKRLQMFEYFRSPLEAQLFLSANDDGLSNLQRALESRYVNTFWVTAATYEQSRLLRLALYEGDYFAKLPS